MTTPFSTNMLDSKAHALRTHSILASAWWQAHIAQKPDDSESIEDARLMRSALDRVEAEALDKFGSDMGHPECPQCRRMSVFGGPRHEASKYCRSGKRNHCACETCY